MSYIHWQSIPVIPSGWLGAVLVEVIVSVNGSLLDWGEILRMTVMSSGGHDGLFVDRHACTAHEIVQTYS